MLEPSPQLGADHVWGGSDGRADPAFHEDGLAWTQKFSVWVPRAVLWREGRCERPSKSAVSVSSRRGGLFMSRSRRFHELRHFTCTVLHGGDSPWSTPKRHRQQAMARHRALGRSHTTSRCPPHATVFLPRLAATVRNPTVLRSLQTNHSGHRARPPLGACGKAHRPWTRLFMRALSAR
jgi:hypothetical protein